MKETTQADWTLTSITCTANGAEITIGTGNDGADFASPGGAGFNPGDTTVKAVITAGDTPTCTFENTRNASARHREVRPWAAPRPSATRSTGRASNPFNRDTAVTNPTQNNPFAFTGLQLGNIYVKETTQADWTLTSITCTANGAEITIGTGNDGADFASPGGAGFNPGDTTVKAVITAGDTPTCTFENTKLATKSGTKFHDLNANGVRDAGRARPRGLDDQASSAPTARATRSTSRP